METNRKRTTIIIILFAVLFTCLVCVPLFPVNITCGAPGAACMPQPDDQGMVRVKYHIEPAVVALLEGTFQTELHLQYYEGYDLRKLGE